MYFQTSYVTWRGCFQKWHAYCRKSLLCNVRYGHIRQWWRNNWWKELSKSIKHARYTNQAFKVSSISNRMMSLDRVTRLWIEMTRLLIRLTHLSTRVTRLLIRMKRLFFYVTKPLTFIDNHVSLNNNRVISSIKNHWILHSNIQVTRVSAVFVKLNQIITSSFPRGIISWNFQEF